MTPFQRHYVEAAGVVYAVVYSCLWGRGVGGRWTARTGRRRALRGFLAR